MSASEVIAAGQALADAQGQVTRLAHERAVKLQALAQKVGVRKAADLVGMSRARAYQILASLR